MRVLLPSPLHSYVPSRDTQAVGATLAEVFLDLDRRYPGIRFRMIDEQDCIRPHMRVFVNGQQEFSLERLLQQADVVQVVQALSGG